MVIQRLALSAIRVDGGTQQRAKTPVEAIEAYALALMAGALFPAVVVFQDGLGENWLADGFLRYAAHKQCFREEIDVEIIEGELRDAILYSCGVNEDHGCRRTNEDKRKAIATLLNDDEWGQRSDNWIAEKSKTTHPTVAKVREELASSLKTFQTETRVGRDGKKYKARKPRKTPSQKAAEEARAAMAANGAADESTPAEQPEPVAVDGWDIPIQDHAADAFSAQPLFDELLAKLKECRKLYATLAEHRGGAYLLRPGISMNSREAWKHKGIENAILNVTDCRPTYTVCPYAYGEAEHNDACTLCHGLNWSRPLSKEELKSKEEMIAAAKEAHGV